MTSNFYVKNATFIYAIEPPTPEEDEFFWDWLEMDLKEQLRKIGFKPETDEKESWVDDHTKILATKTFWDKTGTYSYQIQAVIRSGYYRGANLDYELIFKDCEGVEDEGLSWECIKETLDCEESDKPHTRQARRIEKELDTALNKDLNQLERIYWDNSIPLIHVSTFSNGEAVYKPAKQFYTIKNTRITAKNRA